MEENALMKSSSPLAIIFLEDTNEEKSNWDIKRSVASESTFSLEATVLRSIYLTNDSKGTFPTKVKLESFKKKRIQSHLGSNRFGNHRT